MQTVGGTQGGAARPAYRRRNSPELPALDRTKTQNDRDPGCGHGFLTTRFDPIPCRSLVRDKYTAGPVEYMTRENYEYLRDSYFRYAELMGVSATHDPGTCIGMGMANLVDEMTALVDGHAEVNVDYDGRRRLYFTLYKSAPWSDWTLYWFPLRFVEKLQPHLRRICITFFHDLMRSNGFSTLLGDYDTEMTEWWIVEQLDDLDKEDRKPYRQVLQSYDRGRARRMLDRVSRKRYYKNLPRAVRGYNPANEYEAGLRALLEEGLQFIGEDKPSLMSYGYDPDEEEQPDTQPIPLERQVRVVYDMHDLFTDTLQDMFNCDQEQAATLAPYFTLELSPATDKLFTTDEYTQRFYKWADRLVGHIE